MWRICNFIAGLDEFAKLRKATVSSFVTSVCPSARKKLGFPWTDFLKFYILVFYEKSIKNFQDSLIYDKNIRYFTWRPMYIFNNISLNSS